MNRGSIDAQGGNPKVAVERWQNAQQLRTQHLAGGKARIPSSAPTPARATSTSAASISTKTTSPPAEEHLKDAVAVVRASAQARARRPRKPVPARPVLPHARRPRPAENGSAAAQAFYAKRSSCSTTLNLRNPQVADYKSTLGAIQISSPNCCWATRTPPSARPPSSKAIAPLSELVAQNPGVLLYQRDLAVAFRLRAEIHIAQNDRAAAQPDASQGGRDARSPHRRRPRRRRLRRPTRSRQSHADRRPTAGTVRPRAGSVSRRSSRRLRLSVPLCRGRRPAPAPPGPHPATSPPLPAKLRPLPATIRPLHGPFPPHFHAPFHPTKNPQIFPLTICTEHRYTNHTYSKGRPCRPGRPISFAIRFR